MLRKPPPTRPSPHIEGRTPTGVLPNGGTRLTTPQDREMYPSRRKNEAIMPAGTKQRGVKRRRHSLRGARKDPPPSNPRTIGKFPRVLQRNVRRDKPTSETRYSNQVRVPKRQTSHIPQFQSASRYSQQEYLNARPRTGGQGDRHTPEHGTPQPQGVTIPEQRREIRTNQDLTVVLLSTIASASDQSTHRGVANTHSNLLTNPITERP